MARTLVAVLGVLAGGCTCLAPVQECGLLCDVDGGTGGGGGSGGSGGSGGGGGFGGSSGGSGGMTGTGGGSAGGAGGGAGGGAMPVGDGGCEISDGGGIGVCAAITGYVFAGTSCRGACVTNFSAPGVFRELSSCATSCAAAGFCNEAKWFGRPPPAPPLAVGTFCDEVVARVPAPYSTQELDQALGGIDGGCMSSPTGSDCLLWPQELDQEGYLRACGATLLDSVESVTCRIFL